MKEEEIRPQAIFDEYLRLAAEDTQTYFSEVEREHIDCPACCNKGTVAFEKSGFIYDECQSCRTLYVSPRPMPESFSRYYQESPSSAYWATTFYKETEKARREKLWRPKALEIKRILSSLCSMPDPLVIDIGGGYGIFAEEMRNLLTQPPVVIEPGPRLAEVCRTKGFQVIEKFLEDVSVSDIPEVPKVFVSFELFEHLHDPARFMDCLRSLMSSGDCFIFTTLSGAGVDIQALWQDSKSVMPPHHLNFLNPHSTRLLLQRTGFESLHISRPGKLDIDILDNIRSLIKDRFWKTFSEMASATEKETWQEWIADQGWSSHMWVVCRKP